MSLIKGFKKTLNLIESLLKTKFNFLYSFKPNLFSLRILSITQQLLTPLFLSLPPLSLIYLITIKIAYHYNRLYFMGQVKFRKRVS